MELQLLWSVLLSLCRSIMLTYLCIWQKWKNVKEQTKKQGYNRIPLTWFWKELKNLFGREKGSMLQQYYSLILKGRIYMDLLNHRVTISFMHYSNLKQTKAMNLKGQANWKPHNKVQILLLSSAKSTTLQLLDVRSPMHRENKGQSNKRGANRTYSLISMILTTEYAVLWKSDITVLPTWPHYVVLRLSG